MSPTPEQEPSVDDRDQAIHMDKVDRKPWDTTESDEMAVLRARFPYDESTGLFSYQIGDPNA